MVEQNTLARNIFSGLSTSYDSIVDLMTFGQDRAWKRRMLERLEIAEGSRVLDIGCGTGVLEQMPAMKKRAADVVGVDLTSAMVALARQKGLRTISMLGVADAEHLPFGEGSFDVVVSCYVPKYCDTDRFVKEIARVLKRGGSMAVYDFTAPRGLYSAPLGLYVYGLIPLMGKLVAPVDPSLALTCSALPGLIRFTRWKEELEYALVGNGFSSVKQQALSGGIVTIFWASKG